MKKISDTIQPNQGAPIVLRGIKKPTPSTLIVFLPQYTDRHPPTIKGIDEIDCQFKCHNFSQPQVDQIENKTDTWQKKPTPSTLIVVLPQLKLFVTKSNLSRGTPIVLLPQ